jgi:hypothetical protein
LDIVSLDMVKIASPGGRHRGGESKKLGARENERGKRT